MSDWAAVSVNLLLSLFVGFGLVQIIVRNNRLVRRERELEERAHVVHVAEELIGIAPVAITSGGGYEMASGDVMHVRDSFGDPLFDVRALQSTCVGLIGSEFSRAL